MKPLYKNLIDDSKRENENSNIFETELNLINEKFYYGLDLSETQMLVRRVEALIFYSSRVKEFSWGDFADLTKKTLEFLDDIEKNLNELMMISKRQMRAKRTQDIQEAINTLKILKNEINQTMLH